MISLRLGMRMGRRSGAVPPPTITAISPQAGFATGGVQATSVVITGTNLTGATSVLLAGVEQIANCAVGGGGTTITISTTIGGAAVANGTVQVTTPGGTATGTSNGVFWSFLPTGATVWWDPALVSTVTQASGFVTQVNDRSSNGNNGTATGVGRPTWGSTRNGFNILGQNGASHLDLTFGASQGDYALIIGAQAPGALATYNALAGFAAFSPGLYVHSGQLDWYSAGDRQFTDLSVATSDAFIASFFHSGATGGASKNGTVSSVTPTVSSTEGTTLSIFTEQAGASSSPWNGTIFEVVYYPASISTANRQIVENYMRTKFATP